MSQVTHKSYFVLQQPDVVIIDSAQSAADSLVEATPKLLLQKPVVVADTTHKFQLNADSLLKANFRIQSADSTWLSRDIPYGYEGNQLPITLVNSVGVQAVLLLSVVLTTFAMGIGSKYFEQLIRNFFRVRERASFFTENSVVGFEFKAFLTLQAIALESLISYNMIRELFFLNTLRPNFILGIGLFALVFMVYHLLRVFAISFVGSTFSESRTTSSYISEYFTFMSFWGVILLPIAIAMLYWQIPVVLLGVLLVLPILFGRISYFSKGVKIFFIQNQSIFYIILYLCALEILPLIALFQVLIYTYSFTR